MTLLTAVILALNGFWILQWLFKNKQNKIETHDDLPRKAPPPEFTDLDLYARQVIMPEFTLAQQASLKKARVVILGAGGLGAGLIPSLAGVGVGRLELVDFDQVSVSNLHRQTLFGVDSIGRLKVQVAAERIRRLNPQADVVCHAEALTPALCDRIFPGASLIVDCTDNLPTRLLICDAAMQYDCRVVTGSALRLQGHVLRYGRTTGCYRCLLNEGAVPNTKIPGPHESVVDAKNALMTPSRTQVQRCEDAGVLGPVPALIGQIMALECTRVLAFHHTPRFNFVLFDFKSLHKPFISIQLRSKSDCINCNGTPAYRESDYLRICPSNLCPQMSDEHNITWKELIAQGYIAEPGKVLKGTFIDVRPAPHSSVFSLAGSHQIPLDSLNAQLAEVAAKLDKGDPSVHDTPIFKTLAASNEIYVYCRLGNASRTATARLIDLRTVCDFDKVKEFSDVKIFNVVGGLTALQSESEVFAKIPVP
eukprot:Protomagalhaensia_wolfi_Nauph_80__1618@NODE_1_length_8074_cov_174_317237_g0_i0_p1_GENE_NODE_1_length_8074_cov_174_317237_g0_i0NODE_1_length_8074_cov_174_317237_g0_i0_p1_ORF_typecomplete_len478_score85_41ThiF/PF00899_21/2_7e50Shikimate_DH/PF01488_20/0_00027AlaDh_PNT_C/PF01262_21/0_035Rhodanese/PF00581_20/0_073_NODE_1_length_8074_cov_174_317237_g0_i013802813